MAYLNKVMLIGNVGKDPTFRTFANGNKNASFSLATTRRYRDANGEQKEQTIWHNINAFGKIAEIIEQLGVSKGTQLYVEGALNTRSWDDKVTGQKRSITEVDVENFQILTPRGQRNATTNGGTSYQQEEARQQAQDEEDVDLPF